MHLYYIYFLIIEICLFINLKSAQCRHPFVLQSCMFYASCSLNTFHFFSEEGCLPWELLKHPEAQCSAGALGPVRTQKESSHAGLRALSVPVPLHRGGCQTLALKLCQTCRKQGEVVVVTAGMTQMGPVVQLCDEVLMFPFCWETRRAALNKSTDL